MSDLPLISCLCPTFNRAPNKLWLLEEAIQSFLEQTYPNKELIVCNDTPGQKVEFSHPDVRIYNVDKRFETLSDKLTWMIEGCATGDLLCRWDDDDIQLPWRLAYSVQQLGDNLEWRANNHWYTPGNAIEGESHNGGNSHTRSIWRREVLDIIGGYPPKCSGWEDQEFNRLLAMYGINTDGATILIEDIFSLYRWGVSNHLSACNAVTDDNEANLQAHYDHLGTLPIEAGRFKLQPRWQKDYVQEHQAAVNRVVSTSAA